MTAQAPRGWPEKAPSVLTGKAAQNNQHMARPLLLRLQTGRWLPGRPPANGNLGPKPKGTQQVLFGSWSLQQAGACRAKEGSPLQTQTCFPPISLQLFLPAWFPIPAPKSRAGQ